MKNRRDFIKLASSAAVAACLSPSLSFASSNSEKKEVIDTYTMEEGKNQLVGERWGLVIDTKKLNKDINEKIMEACHKAHNVPNLENKKHQVRWVWEEEYKHTFPDLENDMLNEKLKDTPFLVMCNQCENPACVRACPTQATFQRKDGIVMMDFHRCIGCRFCMAACPYGSRSFNYVNPRNAITEQNKDFPTRMKGVVEKCNMCVERIAIGQKPLCVEVSKGAIVFGNLNDPNSEVRKLLKENYSIRRKVHLGTSPSVYYIV